MISTTTSTTISTKAANDFDDDFDNDFDDDFDNDFDDDFDNFDDDFDGDLFLLCLLLFFKKSWKTQKKTGETSFDFDLISPCVRVRGAFLFAMRRLGPKLWREGSTTRLLET